MQSIIDIYYIDKALSNKNKWRLRVINKNKNRIQIYKSYNTKKEAVKQGKKLINKTFKEIGL